MGHSGRASRELRVRAGKREAVDAFRVLWFVFFKTGQYCVQFKL